MGEGEFAEPEKTSGMHRCIPDRSKHDVKKLISSSSLSFLQPLYSPLRSFELSPAKLAERVIHLHV
jgi:hypothetical protein